MIGGHGNSRAQDFRYKEIVSFKSAYTHVSGNKDKETGSYGTLITSTVEHLNVLDVVTADRVVSRLASQYLPREAKEEGAEPHITPLGSKFENLRIAGCPVEVELDGELFTELDTYGAFKMQFEKDKKFRGLAEARFLWGKLEKDVPESVRARYNRPGQKGLPESQGVILCSLVKNIKASCPGVKRFGNVLCVPQFGRIFLAEYLIEHSHRSLTMMRLELGCAVCGSATITSTSINGRPWP
ncbi:MAG: hypothetical protein PVS2B2_00760 [Candidatus Acidiferrum sp.]